MHFHIKFVAKTCIRDVCFPSRRLQTHLSLFEITNTGCELLMYNDELHFASHIIIANPINTEVAWFGYSTLHTQKTTLSGNNIFWRHSVYLVPPLKRQPTEPTVVNVTYLLVLIYFLILTSVNLLHIADKHVYLCTTFTAIQTDW